MHAKMNTDQFIIAVLVPGRRHKLWSADGRLPVFHPQLATEVGRINAIVRKLSTFGVEVVREQTRLHTHTYIYMDRQAETNTQTFEHEHEQHTKRVLQSSTRARNNPESW